MRRFGLRNKALRRSLWHHQGTGGPRLRSGSRPEDRHGRTLQERQRVGEENQGNKEIPTGPAQGELVAWLLLREDLALLQRQTISKALRPSHATYSEFRIGFFVPLPSCRLLFTARPWPIMDGVEGMQFRPGQLIGETSSHFYSSPVFWH